MGIVGKRECKTGQTGAFGEQRAGSLGVGPKLSNMILRVFRDGFERGCVYFEAAGFKGGKAVDDVKISVPAVASNNQHPPKAPKNVF